MREFTKVEITIYGLSSDQINYDKECCELENILKSNGYSNFDFGIGEVYEEGEY